MHTRIAENSPAKRIVSLDLLRFAAALSVMWYHFTYSPTNSGVWADLNVIARHGYLGVELFFIISGFVVLWSAKGRTVLSFARARVLRLYPEFWPAVLISAGVFAITGAFSAESLTLSDVALNLTMVPQYLGVQYVDGVYWTLGTEIKFYVLLASLMLIRQLPRVERWIYAVLAIQAVSVAIDLGPVVSSLTIGRYGSLFAAGGLFFIVYDEGWTFTRRIGLLAAGVISVLNGLENMGGFIRPEDLTVAAAVTTAAIIAAMFLLFLVIISSQAKPRFVEVAATLGALTYPLYLLHNTGKAIFIHGFDGLPMTIQFFAASAFSLLLSYGVYLLGTRLVRPRLSAALGVFGLRR
jgi:peptidoglycan/LPS O-acetylase OafA/YrhL